MDLQGGWEGGREGECLIRGGLQGRQGTEGRAEKLGWKKGTEGSHEIRAQLTNTWGSRTGSRAVGVPARVCNKHPLPHIRGATAPTHGTSEVPLRQHTAHQSTSEVPLRQHTARQKCAPARATLCAPRPPAAGLLWGDLAMSLHQQALLHHLLALQATPLQHQQQRSHQRRQQQLRSAASRTVQAGLKLRPTSDWLWSVAGALAAADALAAPCACGVA